MILFIRRRLSLWEYYLYYFFICHRYKGKLLAISFDEIKEEVDKCLKEYNIRKFFRRDKGKIEIYSGAKKIKQKKEIKLIAYDDLEKNKKKEN